MKTNLKINVILFFILLSLSCLGQSHELGEVTVEELLQKEHPIEKDAAAAILFDIGKTYFEYNGTTGFVLVTEVTSKIKIYKKEGYSYADVSVPVYVGDTERESVIFSKAYTYNLVNGKVEKTKLKSEGKFTEKVNEFWKSVKISFPNVTEGSIIEYKYIIRSPFLSNLPDWYFQKELPINYSKYETVIPEYFIYNTRVKGYLSPKITNSFKDANHFINQRQISYKQEVTSYFMEMAPSIKDEDFVGNIKDYTAAVTHELSIIKYPNSPLKSLSSSWEDICKSIYDYEKFGLELKKSGYYESDIERLLVDKNSNEEKIIAILEFVKKKVKWNNYYGIFCNDGVKNAYKNSTGNVAEVNLMLVSMLRFSGFEANPVLVSTRSNGIPLFPSRSAFNYLICAIELNGGLILLDATEVNNSFNIMPTRVLNWQGRLIRKDGTSTFVDLKPSLLSKENTLGLLDVDSQGVVSGKIRILYYDYNALRFRNIYSNINKENYLENLEKRLSQIEITDYLLTNENVLSKPVTEEFSFKHSNLVEIIGDKMYFSPLLFFSINDNPFKAERREYPVDFIYPQEDKYTITINLPKGYSVESIPENNSFALENNQLIYRFNLYPSEGKIQMIVNLTINESMIIPIYYNDLKDFFKRIVENQTEKIVLKKS